MVKSIQILLNSPSCTYFPGSVVSGNLVVELGKPKKYKLIDVYLIGKAEVHWTEQQGGGEHSHTVHYRNAETYISVSSTLWRKEDAPNGELQPGVHAWPFQFTLPLNIPPSFEGSLRFGWIRYILYGRIQNSFLKLDRTTATAITVKQLPTIGSAALLVPQQFEKEKIVKFMFGTPQSIKFAFQLPKTTFSMGETVPLHVSVVNESSRNIRLVASIARTEIYTATTAGKYRTVIRKAARVSSDQIEKRQSTGWDTELFIPIVLPPTIKNCRCISVEYRLKVKLKVPWARNAAVSVPIVIHNGQASHNQEQPRVHGNAANEAVPSAPTQQYSPFALPTQQYSYPHTQQYGTVAVSTDLDAASHHYTSSSSTAPLYRHSQQPSKDPTLDRQQYGLTVSSPPQYEDVASSAWGWEYDQPPSYNETEALLPL